MKRVLYIVRRAPGVLADEIRDVILVSGVFEQPTSVLFAGDGVYQLSGLDARTSSVNDLPTYDIEDLYASTDDLASRGIRLEDVRLPVSLASRRDVRELIARHDVVLTD